MLLQGSKLQSDDQLQNQQINLVFHIITHWDRRQAGRHLLEGATKGLHWNTADDTHENHPTMLRAFLPPVAVLQPSGATLLSYICTHCDAARQAV